MKIRFNLSEDLMAAVDLVIGELDCEVVKCGGVLVEAEKRDEEILNVTLKDNAAKIVYGKDTTRFLRGLATLLGWLRDGETENEVKETPIFTLDGAMVDMSRNAVMNVEAVKFYLRKMALMGQNCMMLYTEDTYEIEGRPYFGHLRGRYSKEELKELDKYALTLGIELIPCIQFLGHLATMLAWDESAKFKDTANAMLVGCDETYALIDGMLATVTECFTTKRIHIGMDETHDLGTGAYLDKFGYEKREEIYFKHLAIIIEKIKKLGLEPMMWSDMFFRLAGKGLERYSDYDIRVELPADMGEKTCGIQQVFWDYYRPMKSFYTTNIIKHRILGKNTMFAGGIATWYGFCPNFKYSIENSLAALEACRDEGVKEVIGTAWHNGSEGSPILSLAVLSLYADYNFKGDYSEESVAKCFKNACGLEYNDFLLTERPEHPTSNAFCATRGLTYNDVLLGKLDYYITGDTYKSHYAEVTKQLEAIKDKQGYFSASFDTITKLSDFLENKADFGVRLKKAYDEGDKDALKALLLECDVMIEKLEKLIESHRTSWLQYNKPFGFEVHDVRYGGVMGRIKTAKVRIAAYLDGKINAIEELEEDRLPMRSGDSAKIGEHFMWKRYLQLTSTADFT